MPIFLTHIHEIVNLRAVHHLGAAIGERCTAGVAVVFSVGTRTRAVAMASMGNADKVAERIVSGRERRHRAAGWVAERDRNRAASDEMKPDHEGGGRTGEWSLGPWGICDHDSPETIRMRKCATGAHVLLEEIEVETGATPREVVWEEQGQALPLPEHHRRRRWEEASRTGTSNLRLRAQAVRTGPGSG